MSVENPSEATSDSVENNQNQQNSNETVETENHQESEEMQRIPKRKAALLLSYCGTGYHGMQIQNSGVPTIESELWRALCASGAVSASNSTDPTKVQFMRAARTDKGVHAAGQVVSMKIQDQPGLIEKLNELLPPQIRVWNWVRTVGSFHAKNRCQSRKYEYLLPTYCLRGFSEDEKSMYQRTLTSEERQQLRVERMELNTEREAMIRQKIAEKSIENGEEMDEDDRKIMYLRDKLPAEEMQAIRSYRLSSEKLTRVREILKLYEGTHLFHNYTIGRPHHDRSCQRHMLSFTCSEPFVRQNTEWISLQVTGQSFMLHQIRKMVGMLVLIINTDAPLSLIDRSYEKCKLNIPKAPALGLLLEEPLFSAYNRYLEKNNHHLVNFTGEPITFEPYRAEIDAFKEKWIYSRIVEEEERLDTYDLWMRSLHDYSHDFTYMTKDGIIPQEFYEEALRDTRQPHADANPKKRKMESRDRD